MFDYPDEPAALRQVAVIEESGELAIYRLWFRYYALKPSFHYWSSTGFTSRS